MGEQPGVQDTRDGGVFRGAEGTLARYGLRGGTRWGLGGGDGVEVLLVCGYEVGPFGELGCVGEVVGDLAEEGEGVACCEGGIEV